MQVKGQNSVQVYYSSVIIAAVGLMIYGLSQLWSSGSANFEAVTAAFESSSIYEGLKSRNDIDQVRELVDQDRVRDGYKHLEELEKNIKQLDRTQRVSSFSQLNLGIQDAKADFRR